MEDIIAGGWTPFKTDISREEMDIFNKALGGIVGVSYEPIAVASQIVSGVNYKFFCNAKVVYKESYNYGVIIEIYKPLEGDPHVVIIYKV